MSEPPTTQPLPPRGTHLLAWGVLQPGDTTTIPLKKQLPPGFEPIVVNVRASRARLRMFDVEPLSVKLINEGVDSASFMLFAATVKTKRVMGAVGMLLHALAFPPPPKDPTP